MANRFSQAVLAATVALAALLAMAPQAEAVVYCNITEVTATELSNGVQISVKADGILQMSGWWGQQTGNRFEIQFNNARNQTGNNFIDVSLFPVSHIELSVPQGATEGVGVTMAVVMSEVSPVSVSTNPDRQSVLLTVRSSRTLEGKSKPKPAAAEKKAEQEKDLVVEVAEGRVSVTAVKCDLHKLLGEIAKQTGANLAVDDAVSGEASLHLRNLTVEECLNAIASAHGLALSKVNGVFMFSRGVPQDLAAYRLSGTASFPMRYTRAQAASGLLPTFLYSYLHVNEEQNAVVVTAPQQMLDKIRADLQAVDIAPPQILMEAIAVEFTDTRDADKVLSMLRGDVTGKTTDTGEAEYSATANARTGEITYNNVGELPSDFEARLRSLETEQRCRIRAAPRMAVINGHEAEIFIGARRFMKVEYISYGQATEKIQGVDVGVKLMIRPLTGGGGEITLTVDPNGSEVSNVSEVDPRTGLPVLSARRTGTTVRVKDGETVVLGGLSQRQSEERVTRIPVLGSLPLVGSLFRSHSRSDVNSELLLFITPHILTPEGRLADEKAEQEIRQRFLTPGTGPGTGS